jgi:hypothetical protein
MGNALIATNTLITLVQQTLQLSTLLKTAQTEGRDLTDAELAQIQSDYVAAHSQLDQDIAAKASSNP